MIPDVIPEEYHDDYESLSPEARLIMIRKFEKMEFRKEKELEHEMDSITPHFFTINQRIQIYNLVRQAKMDYNVSIHPPPYKRSGDKLVRRHFFGEKFGLARIFFIFIHF